VEAQVAEEEVAVADQIILEEWDLLLLYLLLVCAVESEVKAMLLEAARTQ
jgi:hypothetical protein